MSRIHHDRVLLRTVCAAALVAASLVIGASVASGGAEAPVGLGAADNFAVLAGAGITNTGSTTITGDVGTHPTTTETGFGPGADSVTLTGTNHGGDAVTQQAKADLVTAYVDAASRPGATEIPTDLAGQNLGPGVYDSADGTFANSGTLTLTGEGVYIFQTESTLITASGSSVNLTGGADACNVYWQVGSSATLGTGSNLQGTILALTTITMNTTATLQGRALARNGAVTLDTNTITRASCFTPTTTTTTVTSSTNPSTPGQPVTFTATVTAADGSTPTGSVEFFDNGVSIGIVPLDENGQASITVTDLGPGEHDITAVYLGGPGFLASSTAAALRQIVGPPLVVEVVPTFTG
jgi:hypothetical protein